MTDQRPDPGPALAPLKDFQRLTVDTAYDRLWGEDDPVTRFLVADEVGLGKTLVARGVVARTIEHLWDRDDRIDIVYICSNRQIAQQNLRRLHDGSWPEIPHADRLTMLPLVLRDMGKRKVNIISFTPGTSFRLSDSGGKVGERALLLTLLQMLWGRDAVYSPKWRKFFRGAASDETMAWQMWHLDRSTLTEELVEAFRQGLDAATTETGAPLVDDLRSVVDEFAYLRQGKAVTSATSRRRYRLIGRLRRVLAQASISHLKPDLVILDEFQRFGGLLHGDDEAAALAQQLLGSSEVETQGQARGARVLLLSATPFKMYTLPDEPEGDDHYRDFTNTVRFLAGPERAELVRGALSDMRTALVQGNLEQARSAKVVAEGELRRVMARTERLAVSATRDGMLTDVGDLPVRLTPDDVRDYTAQSAVARALHAGDVIEYWRSTPYVFELMEKYQIKRAIDQDLQAGCARLGGVLSSRLRREDIDGYREIDLANPKLRWLADDVLRSGVWRVAWLPPVLPYYSPGGAYAEPALRSFTKRLVFSAWSVAPKGIATMLSYEVERRLAEQTTSSAHREYFAARRSGLLAFDRAAGRLSGMPVLALMYPAVALARAGDPLDVARELDRTLPLTVEELRSEVRRRVEDLLAQLPQGEASGRQAQAWYWAAPFLLDRVLDPSLSVEELPFGRTWDALAHGEGVFDAHVQEAVGLDPATLGPQPDDLADLLVDLAIGGPGVCALRALGRVVTGTAELLAVDLRSTASDWSWALRSLFSSPEVMAMLQARGDDSYWREVVRHGVDGNLQSVLDEYARVLIAAQSLDDKCRDTQLAVLSEAFTEGTGLRASAQAIDFFTGTDTVEAERRRLRTHFAVRYGRSTSQDDVTVQHESQVRGAFNSPFWPFVLASTSVGQEGLDFHHYSHAVVHWNLPSNPVDLEQREGRVHRYRGHAVRKNIARKLGGDPRVVAEGDPWTTLFELAASERGEGQSQIFPDWVYPTEGGATIERYVPVLPMSRERQHYRRLLRTLGAYRLTMGQPRQADLLAYVGSQADLVLDLSPAPRLSVS